jgi:hypothetical protein
MKSILTTGFTKTATNYLSPWEAMEVLHMTQELMGKVLTDDDIRAIRKTVGRLHHPDLHPGKEQTYVQMMHAVDSLEIAAKSQRPLPTAADNNWTPAAEGTHPAGGYTAAPNSKPPDAKNISDGQFRIWCEQVIQDGFTEFFIREKYTGYDVFGGRVGNAPYGTKGRKQTLPPNFTGDQLYESMKRVIGTQYPGNLIDIRIFPNEAWVSYMDYPEGGQQFAYHIRSISVEKKKARQPKQPGVGMKPNDVIQYLTSKGLQRLGGGTKYVYYGLAGDPHKRYIRVAAKTVRPIEKWKDDRGQPHETPLAQEAYFGAVTKELLDSWISRISRPSTTASGRAMAKSAANFQHKAEIPIDFAKSVARVMMNQAGPDEWELFDRYVAKQSPKVVLGWVRSILVDNGVPDVEEEIKWWGQQIMRPLN